MSTGYQDFQYLAGVSILNVAEGIEFTIKEVKGVVDINIESVAETVVFDVNVQGTVDVNIKSQEAEITITGTVDINAIASVVKIEPSEEAVFEIKPQAGVVFNISGDVNANITNETIDVNITNSSVTVVVQSGTINANITNTSINVNVQNKVDVEIKNASIDVNVTNSVLSVSVSGQASVSIDNASVYLNVKNENHTENTRTLQNDGGTIQWTYGDRYFGKWFPHGARGFITKVYIYCKPATTDYTLYVYFSIAPNSPYLFYVSTTVLTTDTEGWKEIDVNMLWNYDSLFITIHGTTSDLVLAWDTETPADRWYHETDMYSLQPRTGRQWIRVKIRGQTSGDIPVSGTVNTINIPNKTSESSTGIVYIDYGEEKTLVEIEGTGVVKYIMLWCNYRTFYFTFYVDDELLSFSGSGYTVNPSDLNLYDPDKLSNRVKLLRYDDTNKQFTIEWLVEIPFKKSFKITASHGSTSQQEARVLYCIYEKLS